MHQLDGGAAAAGLHHQQARGHQALDQARQLGAGAERAGENFGHAVELDHGARALGRDQAAEQRLRPQLVVGRQAVEDSIGVARERARDAAEVVVAVGGEQALLAVAAAPELAGRELEQRQGAAGGGEVVEHMLDDLAD